MTTTTHPAAQTAGQRTHNRTLQTKATQTLAGCVRRIMATYDMATSEQAEQGAHWYAGAGRVVDDIAQRAHISRDRAAVIVAHLSPQTTWQRNVAGAYQVAAEGRADYCLRNNVKRALAALNADDPWSTFGPSARKTRRFARNLLGYTDVVTVDVWAMRVAFGRVCGAKRRTGDNNDLEQLLDRVGVYEAVEAAYLYASRALGVLPPAVQAATWIVARNGRVS